MKTTALKAIGLMLVAMSLIPIGDTAGKLLLNTYGVGVWFIAWSRFLFGCLVVLLLLVFTRAKVNPRYKAVFQDYRVWLRAFFIVSGISSILYSLQTEPIANVFAAFFIGPIISFVGAAIILKEKVTFARTVLLLIGFAGVLLVVKPGFSQGAGIYYAVLAGTFYGCFLVMNRLLANTYVSSTLLLSQLAIGSVLLLPLGIQHLPDMTYDTGLSIGTLVLISALGSAGGNMLLLFATKLTAATKLAPLVYFQLVAATGLGAVVFNDQPDWIVWSGILVIIISGVGSVFLPPSKISNTD